MTPVRGAGHPQGTFVMERLMDRVAKELSLDPVEARRRNMVPGDAMPYPRPLKSRGGAAADACSFMSWKTNRSCSTKLPMIVTSAEMIAATM